MRTQGYLTLVVALAGCAKANSGSNDPDAGGQGSGDASCGEICDQDADTVIDTMDMCPDTAAGAPVNHLGCSDAQLTATLQPFPAFNLTWTPTGNLGRAGGLTWTYVGIERTDLFHIYWLICDDPATPCGLSLDGPLDTAGEGWQFAAATSDMPSGKLVFTNTTRIALADLTTPQLDGRLTVTISDGATPIVASDVVAMHVMPRSGSHGAEIKGTSFTVVALAEVKDPAGSTWTPYADYYDAAATPMAGGGATVSFGGSFYAK